jgi:uncharacterized membrane protein
MPTDSSLLEEVPLFAALSEADRATLASHAEEVRFLSGDRIFRRGDPGGTLYIVCNGRVEITLESNEGERIVLETAEAGHFFGELSLVDGEARSANAYALEETLCLRIDRNDLIALFRARPDSALDVLNVMASRLRTADRLMRSRPLQSPNQEVVQRSTMLQRAADKLAEFSGSLSFLAVHIVWFSVWSLLNAGIFPGVKAFDPFPFGFLTMLVSLEAILLSCFLLISQNRTAAHDRIRSDVEYTANIKAALEVSQLHVKLDDLYAQTMQRMDRLERHAQLSPFDAPPGRNTRFPV